MLRDSEQPDKSWQDYEEELDPGRAFYAEGSTEPERDIYAQRRCAKINRVFEKRPDLASGFYYFCRERRKKK